MKALRWRGVLLAAWLQAAGGFLAWGDGIIVTSTGPHDFSNLLAVTIPAGRVDVADGPPDPDNIVTKLFGAPINEELVLERPVGSDTGWRKWRQDVHDFGSASESYHMTIELQVLGGSVFLEFLDAWPSEYEVFAGPNDEAIERLVIQYTQVNLFP